MGMSGCGGAGAPAPMTTQTAGQVAGQNGGPALEKPVGGGGGFSIDQAKLAPILAELTKVIQQISSMVGGASGGGPGQGDPTQAPSTTLGGGPAGSGSDIATKMLADLDADKNGQVNTADVTQHATTGSQFAYLAAAVLSISNRPSLDVAGLTQLTRAFRHADGAVDKASFQSGLLGKGHELLARFDANRDGKLDSTESGALTSSLPR